VVPRRPLAQPYLVDFVQQMRQTSLRTLPGITLL
jgi:hypothetical protein